MKLTGAAILVSRGMKHLQAAPAAYPYRSPATYGGLMAYRFEGFFARPSVRRPDSLPHGVEWRTIDTPFVGVGVRLLDADEEFVGSDELPEPTALRDLAIDLGLDAADCWIYLTYVCWGGDIDFVYGLGSCKGVPFGPVTESEHDKVVGAYTGLMETFGVSSEVALRFEPFARGYWDAER
jgi:hypothetical protein